MVNRALAVWAGLVADRSFGEPPAAWHPVARFGQVMAAAEKLVWSDRRWPGAAFALGGAGLAAATGAVLSGRGSPSRRLAAVAGSTYVSVAARALRQAAEDVTVALDSGDLTLARARLRALVGRRTEQLDEAEVVRAVVESVAENTVDAVVAPVFWAAIGGAPGALAYRAVNTLDAMVGHRSLRYRRFGWASARADDAANWVPARLTAALVASVRPGRAKAIWQSVRRDAPGHPSPNAGVAEAAFAAALGVRLGGDNDYDGILERRPPLGRGPGPDREHIAGACRLSDDIVRALEVLAVGWAGVSATRGK